jgi:DNA-cytosine methyltransferase
MNVLDLFSGIGGFSLGLERTGGFRTVAFCEIDPFCRRVLAKHWPEVPCYDDVRSLTADRLRADGISVDVICGGFPCQDISVAGNGAGLDGERSGLWREYARLVGELRPRLIIVENVAALLGRGLGDVLGDLAALGYDAEWHCIPAAAVGAPHRRDRIWIVAHDAVRRWGLIQASSSGIRDAERRPEGASGGCGLPSGCSHVAHATSVLRDGRNHHDGGGINLETAVVLRWPTPTARDWKSGKASAATMARNSRPLSEVVGGHLNPTWVEGLMGFPHGWTDLAVE